MFDAVHSHTPIVHPGQPRRADIAAVVATRLAFDMLAAYERGGDDALLAFMHRPSTGAQVGMALAGLEGIKAVTRELAESVA